MRRDPNKNIRRAILGLAIFALMQIVGVAAATAQAPEPRVPDIHERSGLLQRFELYNKFKGPLTLPKDPYRDNYYGFRYGDHNKFFDTNTYYDGGLYGVRLPAKDTASIFPFFYGAPGRARSPRKAARGGPRTIGPSSNWSISGSRWGCITIAAATSRSTISTRSAPDPAPITGPGSSRVAEAIELDSDPARDLRTVLERPLTFAG